MTVEMSSGRVAVVTGANRGIGLATARRLAADGFRVAATYRSEPPPGDLDANPFFCDVTDPKSVESLFDEVRSTLGPVEVLVSNAGITRDGLVLRMDDDDFTDVLDANLTGGFRVAKAAVRHMMRTRWGRIIFVSSVVGTTGQAGQANYAAAKAGLVGLSRSLAREFASRNITVNLVAPGPVATDMTDQLTGDQRAAIIDAVPLGRFASAEEVAAAIAFLASDDAGYITGATIAIDGGLGMGS